MLNNRRFLWIVAIASASIVAPALFAGHGDEAPAAGDKPAAALCPVMEEPVNLAVSAETDSGPVFFCCPRCIEKFNANPEKFTKAVAEQRKALAPRPKVQTVCPVSGKPVDEKVSIEHNGQTIHFCCEKCPPMFQKDPAKYQKALANSYTYQTKCPVSGEEVDPAAFVELANGGKVYLCCSKCAGKLLADPEKYAGNLESQGYKIKAKDMIAKGAAKGGGEHDHAGHDHGHDH